MKTYKRYFKEASYKVIGHGEERINFGKYKSDNHFALFWDGVLSGLAWFSNLSVFNNWDAIHKKHGNTRGISRGNLGDLLNSKPASEFKKEYGEQAKKDIEEAIKFYNDHREQ